jgi:hypothetical protein
MKMHSHKCCICDQLRYCEYEIEQIEDCPVEEKYFVCQDTACQEEWNAAHERINE